MIAHVLEGMHKASDDIKIQARKAQATLHPEKPYDSIGSRVSRFVHWGLSGLPSDTMSRLLRLLQHSRWTSNLGS